MWLLSLGPALARVTDPPLVPFEELAYRMCLTVLLMVELLSPRFDCGVYSLADPFITITFRWTASRTFFGSSFYFLSLRFMSSLLSSSALLSLSLLSLIHRQSLLTSSKLLRRTSSMVSHCTYMVFLSSLFNLCKYSSKSSLTIFFLLRASSGCTFFAWLVLTWVNFLLGSEDLPMGPNLVYVVAS